MLVLSVNIPQVVIVIEKTCVIKKHSDLLIKGRELRKDAFQLISVQRHDWLRSWHFSSMIWGWVSLCSTLVWFSTNSPRPPRTLLVNLVNGNWKKPMCIYVSAYIHRCTNIYIHLHAYIDNSMCICSHLHSKPVMRYKFWCPFCQQIIYFVPSKIVAVRNSLLVKVSKGLWQQRHPAV